MNNIKNSVLELVGHGHPDRFADYLSELIMYEHIKKDKTAKTAIEVMVTRDKVFIGGEVSSKEHFEYNDLIINAIKNVYGEKWWPNYKDIKIINNVKKQSNELNSIQDSEIVAADQGVIYGLYDEERYFYISRLHWIMEAVIDKFNLSPDWKLLFYFDSNNLTASLCGVDKKEDFKLIKDYIKNISNEFNIKLNDIKLNPIGIWKIGGPLSDTGMTGRKIVFETFGTGAPHGGGAFCGKDFSKVDKTGIIQATSIAIRYYQENNLNTPVLVQLEYEIGSEKPNVKIFHQDSIQEVSLDDTLNEYIESNSLYSINWPDVVLKGGLVPGFLVKKPK